MLFSSKTAKLKVESLAQTTFRLPPVGYWLDVAKLSLFDTTIILFKIFSVKIIDMREYIYCSLAHLACLVLVE
jgi:hypothetical protein